MKDETPVMTITADGSPTLYLPTIDEHYHSVKGAVAESRHVYIDMALRASGKKEIDLFECGLGTGLNAFLSLLESEKSDCRIRYTVIEAYPLAPEQATALGYPDIIAPEYRTLFEQIHSCDWGKPVNITPRFSLHKIKGDLTTYPLEENSYDVIYFDAFAPEKQPEMWSAELLGRIARSLREGRRDSFYLLRQRRSTPPFAAGRAHRASHSRPARRKERDIAGHTHSFPKSVIFPT